MIHAATDNMHVSGKNDSCKDIVKMLKSFKRIAIRKG